MTYLVDTNVVSEWVRPHPDPGVVTWLADIDEDQVYISVVTLAELRYGIERMEPGRRRKRLDQWLRDELPLRFEGRILPMDEAVAESWGKLVASREALGRPIQPVDAFIAATAAAHCLTLVTRNAGDFAPSVESVLNPWKDM